MRSPTGKPFPQRASQTVQVNVNNWQPDLSRAVWVILFVVVANRPGVIRTLVNCLLLPELNSSKSPLKFICFFPH